MNKIKFIYKIFILLLFTSVCNGQIFDVLQATTVESVNPVCSSSVSITCDFSPDKNIFNICSDDIIAYVRLENVNVIEDFKYLTIFKNDQNEVEYENRYPSNDYIDGVIALTCHCHNINLQETGNYLVEYYLELESGTQLPISTSAFTITSNLGLPCDDGDPMTQNDIYVDDCLCQGTGDCVDPFHDDYEELIKLYNSTNGTNWTNNNGWDVSCDPCDGTWYGIECENGRVTCIDLDGNPDCLDEIHINSGGNNLTGTIDSLNFPYLKYISLSNNNFSGNIKSFSGSENIEIFHSVGSNLGGEIPDLSAMSNLRIFDVWSNELLEGVIPSLETNIKLEYFRCAGNSIEGSIPNLSSLENLKFFDCNGNNIEGVIPDLSSLEKLEEFYCGYNKIEGIIPDLSFNIELSNFSCPDNKITGTIPNLNSLTKLERFFARNNQLSNTIPSLASLEKLKIFDVQNNNLDGEIPPLNGLDSLVGFNCSYNTLEGEIPFISQLSNLLRFQCASNLLSGELPDLPSSIIDFICYNNQLTGSIPDFIPLNNLQAFFANNNDFSDCIGSNSLCTLGYVDNAEVDTLFISFFVSPSGYNLDNNPKLPWSGEIEAFCNGESQIDADCDDGNLSTENDKIQVDCSCAGVPKCNDPLHLDYNALIELYNTTGGENWLTNDGWGQSCDPCDGTWYGVQCQNERVININLENNGLTGNLSSLNFSELISFNANNNALVGSLPLLDNIAKLVYFECNDNQFTGSIPPLDNVPNLEWFRISYNELTGSIPSLNLVPNLKHFNCGNNTITGQIPSLDEVPNLEVFFCGVNNLSGNIPSLNNLLQLEIFNCSQNQLTGSIPFFDEVPKLEVFNCSQNSLSGSIPKLDQVPSLVSFNCSSNELSAELPELDQVPELSAFFCSKNQLSGQIPSLDHVPNLKRLICNDNLLSGCYFDEICFLLSPGLFECSWNNNIIEGCQYDFRNNPKLPWEGNPVPFCNGEDQKGAPCDDGDDINGTNDTIQEDCSCGPCIDKSYELDDETICFGDSFTYNNIEYSTSSFIEETFQSIGGCDSMISFSLNVLPQALYIWPIEEYCAGQSVTIGELGAGGQVFNQSAQGILTMPGKASSGCDSLISYNLIFSQASESNLSEIICAGEELIVGNETFDSSGDYEIVLINNDGCDSTVNLDLSVLPNETLNLELELCAGQTIKIGSETISENAIGTEIITDAATNGCDSIINYEIVFSPAIETSEEITICTNDSYFFHGLEVSEEGQYTKTLQTLEGCDSIAVLNLYLYPELFSEETEILICEGEMITIDGVVFDESNLNHTFYYIDQNGCDSLHYVEVGIDPNDDNCLDELIITPSNDITFPNVDESIREIIIYNRWGSEVFKIDNPIVMQTWDGRTNNGNMLPEGTYYFIIFNKTDGSNSTSKSIRKGSITLLN